MIGGKKREHEQMKKPVALDKAEIKAFLGPGSKFEGKLSFDEVVRLDGSFTGEIKSSDTLIVGDTAVIEGDIAVGALVMSGRFNGNIKASNRIELRAPAKVEGTIEAPILLIEENVSFNGQIKMPGAESDQAVEKSRKNK